MAEIDWNEVVAVVRRMNNEKKSFVSGARVEDLVLYSRRHCAKAAGLQFERAVLLLTLIADFQKTFNAHEQVVNPRMKMAGHTRSGSDAEHRRLHRPFNMYYAFLAPGAAGLELNMSNVLNCRYRSLPHQHLHLLRRLRNGGTDTTIASGPAY